MLGLKNTEQLDKEFEQRRLTEPNLTFAEFYAQLALEIVKSGESHPTLGQKLDEGVEWSNAGKKRFSLFWSIASLNEHSRVIDYGCGSLRIGQHFIRALEPEHYVGLDVIDGLYRVGSELLEDDVMDVKRPFLGRIGNPADEARAAGHNADLVLSSAVAFHVHPDELGVFSRNILEFSKKPGCIVLFDAVIFDSEIRYAHRGWSRTLRQYKDVLPSLDFVKMHNVKDYKRAGNQMQMALLEFRRPV